MTKRQDFIESEVSYPNKDTKLKKRFFYIQQRDKKMYEIGTEGSDCRIPGPAIYMCRCALKNEVYNNTVEPRYNEVSRYRKKCSLYRGLRYSEDPTIMNYLVNSKNIRYSGVI